MHGFLHSFVRREKRGALFAAETGFLIERDPDTVRAADCAFVRAERLPDRLPEHYLPFAPDLAVETLSPDDRAEAVQEKVAQWLASGTREVWVLDPARRSVTVHRPGVPPRVLLEADTLEGGEVLPGFRLAVREIFS